MKVILLDNIKGVGKKDEIINASDGYARNFLFPKKLAVEANKENMAKLNSKNEAKAFRKETEKNEALKLAEKIRNITLEIKVKAGENGRIFGGVTAKEISEELNKKYQINIDKKKIALKDTIKNVGTFSANIKLYEGISEDLNIKVDTDLHTSSK